MATYREESRENWERNKSGNEDSFEKQSTRLSIGCLQRIADACEVMGRKVAALEADRDSWKRFAESRSKTNEYLLRRIAGLKGALTRLKAKEK